MLSFIATVHIILARSVRELTLVSVKQKILQDICVQYPEYETEGNTFRQCVVLLPPLKNGGRGAYILGPPYGCPLVARALLRREVCEGSTRTRSYLNVRWTVVGRVSVRDV